MNKCVYCRCEITNDNLSARLLEGNYWWCNRCKEGCFLYYEKYTTEELVRKKGQLLGSILYYNTNAYLIISAHSLDLYRAELENKLQELHNISISLEQRQILGVK